MKDQEPECRAVEDVPDTLPLRTILRVYVLRSLPRWEDVGPIVFTSMLVAVVIFVATNIGVGLVTAFDTLTAYCGGPEVLLMCMFSAVMATLIINPDIKLPWDFYHGRVNEYLE